MKNHTISIIRSKQKDYYFTDNIFKSISQKAMFVSWFKSHQSLRPSDANMCHQPMLSLVQIMACHLTGDNPLSEPMLEYC